MSETTEFLGCGDNSCIFERPRGMGTNGGCRCFKDWEDKTIRTRVRRAAMRQAREVAALREQLRTAWAALGCRCIFNEDHTIKLEDSHCPWHGWHEATGLSAALQAGETEGAG